MKTIELIAWQKGYLEGASKQRQETASNVFSYIIDNGEMIPEETCVHMLADFLTDPKYNKSLNGKIINKCTKRVGD